MAWRPRRFLPALSHREGVAYSVPLEPQVRDDGLFVGELRFEVRQDHTQARRVRRQLGHMFDSTPGPASFERPDRGRVGHPQHRFRSEVRQLLL
jgi:hypothetical protein